MSKLPDQLLPTRTDTNFSGHIYFNELYKFLSLQVLPMYNVFINFCSRVTNQLSQWIQIVKNSTIHADVTSDVAAEDKAG